MVSTSHRPPGWTRVPPEVRREILRRVAQGQTYREILDEVDVSTGAITNVLRPLGGVVRRAALQPPSGLRLSIEERQSIWAGVQAGESIRTIARRLDRAPSTVCR